jgi:hypothetical protein
MCSWASLLVRTFASPCFGHKPKVRVTTKTFMKIVKRQDAFFIYVFPSPDVEPHPHDIPSQYQEFKDVLEKKNADTLSKH